MDSIFGVPWDVFQLQDLEAFLVAAEDEGVTWEAKGTERPRPASVLKHVSAFANSIGGFYIVGASREKKTSGPWRIDPVEFVGDEPGLWLGKVIRNGLRPAPAYDVRAWEVDNKHVAVVNVDSVAEPPCMTAGGEVFMRVSGESPKVQDPATLRGLLDRGQSRAIAAEAEALRATDLVSEEEPDPPSMRLRLALAPTGRIDDVQGRLFSEPFVDRVATTISRLPPDPLFHYGRWTDYRIQAGIGVVNAWEGSPENRQRWMVRARWDGTVTVGIDIAPSEEDPRVDATAVFGTVVIPAVRAAEDLVTALGGYGRAHVVLRAIGRHFKLASVQGAAGFLPADPQFRLQTWTDGEGQLKDEQLDRMRRDLVRACGVMVYEPEIPDQ